MRLLAAVLVCWVMCSVKSQTTEGEDFVTIIAKSTIVYNVGDTKAIYCNSSIDPIEWYSPQNKRFGKKSNKNTRIYVEKRTPSRGVPLIIHNLQISDGGNYTCKAGDLNATIDIIVGEKVNIVEKFVNMEGEEGRSITMKCESKGYPAPVVVWYRENSQPIPNNKHKYAIRADDNYNMLEIKKLDHMDVGDYVCKVRQKALSYYTEKSVHLSVQHKPVLYNSDTNSMYTKVKSEEVYAIHNETKNITCSAIANPQPEYHWCKTSNGYDGEEITDPDKVFHSQDGNFSVLMLRMQDDEDIGEYKCTASNAKGKESVIYHVSYGNKPVPPDFVELVEANVTELVFNVTCLGCPLSMEDDVSLDPKNLVVTGYYFELVPAKEPYDPDWESALGIAVPIISPNDTFFTVGPLANSTKYHVRVRSINAAGYSEWVRVEPDPETTSRAVALATAALLVLAAYVFTLAHY